MSLVEDYKLSAYQDYGLLGTKENIHLVRDKRNGQICVKKEMEFVQENIVSFRKTCEASYFPKIYQVVKKENKIIIIEEYINGVTLEEYMMGKPLREEQAIDIACQICKALLCLHKANPIIIYRDLKAENVMLTNDGKVKLVDFDISREFQQGKKRDTMLLGTAQYAAPEQFGYFQTDNRTDIYAFGVLLNYMLTGSFPDKQIVEGKYKSLVKKCIEMEPSKRYQSIEEILEEFDEKIICIETNIKIKKKWWLIPGFRTKTWWKMLLATLVYSLIIIYEVDSSYMYRDKIPYPMLLEWIAHISIIVANFVSIFLIFDYWRPSFMKKINRFNNVVIRILCYFAVWFVAMFLATGVHIIIADCFF